MAQKHVDPVNPDPNSDPDPQHWFLGNNAASINIKNARLKTIFFAYYFLKVGLHHFSKIKSQKESQNSRNQGFLTIFA